MGEEGWKGVGVDGGGEGEGEEGEDGKEGRMERRRNGRGREHISKGIQTMSYSIPCRRSNGHNRYIIQLCILWRLLFLVLEPVMGM